MLFVDGENLTFRAQEFAKRKGAQYPLGDWYAVDKFIWSPNINALGNNFAFNIYGEYAARRAYYYTSICGDDLMIEDIETKLWNLKFTPRVFKKTKQQDKAKGVDISLTKDMLSHAFMDHYQLAVLISGDGDHIPLVEEVKRLGKRVVVWFFGENDGLNRRLRLAADDFVDISPLWITSWRTHTNLVDR
jgi:uncharacterized LabA/DUF88 family protein